MKEWAEARYIGISGTAFSPKLIKSGFFHTDERTKMHNGRKIVKGTKGRISPDS